MIRNYYWVIHITIEKIIIGNTQRAHDDSGTSPEGPKVKPTRETTRNPQGTNTKIDDFMKKLFLGSNSPCITYLFLFFTGRANIQKF